MPSRSAPAFQQPKVDLCFHLADFVDISYLTHFAIASLVAFAELCILLCYEVLGKEFQSSSYFCPPFCLS